MNPLICLQREVTWRAEFEDVRSQSLSHLTTHKYVAPAYKEETDNVEGPQLRDLFYINQNPGR